MENGKRKDECTSESMKDERGHAVDFLPNTVAKDENALSKAKFVFACDIVAHKKWIT